MDYQPHPDDWAHQTFAVTESIRLENEGVKSMCITSPTGGGKSRMVQRRCEYSVANGRKVAVMSNRILLTTQLLRGLDKAGIKVGCRASGFEAWSDIGAPVQVISGQTEFARVLKPRQHGESTELFAADELIVDEAHLLGGDKFKEIIDEYKSKHNATVIGISATPLGISHIYDELIIAGNNSELRKCGALVHAKCYEPAVIDLPKVRRSKTGLFSQTELDDAVRAIWSQHVVGHVFKHWKDLNPDGRASLGMAPGVPESRGLAREFFARGVNCAHIDGEGMIVNGVEYATTEQKDRDEVFAMSKDGRCQMIWNRFIMREAVDLPWLYCMTLATPIADLKSFVQSVGRVLRACEGKDFAIILDHAGSIRMHGSPNMDRDKEWLQYFHAADADKITKDRQERLTSPTNKEPEPITCPKCSQVRSKGDTCPGCGFKHTKSVRQVIQESGKLKPTTGDLYHKRRPPQEKPDTVKKWEQCYWRCKRAKRPMTFSQARALFFRDNHYYPPDNLPNMPKDRTGWDRRINDVPYSDLYPRREHYESVAPVGAARDGEHQAKAERRLF